MELLRSELDPLSIIIQTARTATRFSFCRRFALNLGIQAGLLARLLIELLAAPTAPPGPG